MTAKARILSIVGSVLLFSMVLPNAAGAEEKQQIRKKFKDKIHVVQPKPVLQKGRFEAAPKLGVTMNDSVVRNYKVGANLNFHIIEPLYIGAVGEWYDFGGVLGGTTDVFEQVQNQTGTSAEGAVLNWYGGLDIGYVPFWGKFALFNRGIAFYDFAVTVGGGAVNASSIKIPTGTTGGAGSVSLSGRIFFNKWLALTVEIRDIIFMANLSTGAETVSALTNIASAGIGIGFFLPTTFEYSEKIIEVPGS